MLLILLFLSFCNIFNKAQSNLTSVDGDIVGYFDSDSVNSMKQEWMKYHYSYASLLKQALENNFGRSQINVYVKHPTNALNVADGFYLCDNMVDLFFHEMHMREVPRFHHLQVALLPHSNSIMLYGKLQKFFVDTQYFMMRNQSAVVNPTDDTNPYGVSPFVLSTVQPNGPLTIEAKDCSVEASYLTRLNGKSLDVGYHTFRLQDCVFTVEINSRQTSMPPVIAPYFSPELSIQIQRLLAIPIASDLGTHLQASVYGFVNTSNVLGDNLDEYMSKQQDIFVATHTYMRNLILSVNQIAADKLGGGITSVKDKKISWTEDGVVQKCVVISDITLTGLDQAYAAHNGGPTITSSPRAVDTIRYPHLQLYGKITSKNIFQEPETTFYFEIKDFGINLEIAMNGSKAMKDNGIQVLNWRILETSFTPDEQLRYRQIVVGYLTSVLPDVIMNYFIKCYELVDTDNKIDDDKEHQCEEWYRKKIAEEKRKAEEQDRKL